MTAVRDYNGQQYAEIARLPHTCRDGRETQLTRWWSLCADCGDPFTFTAPTLASKFAPNRRCKACKKPGRRVKVAA